MKNADMITRTEFSRFKTEAMRMITSLKKRVKRKASKRSLATTRGSILSIKKRFSKISKRSHDIIENQKHYLRQRAPAVLEKQKMAMRATKKLAEKLHALGRISMKTSTAANKNHAPRGILLVTNNQARKLRVLAESDLRPILNSLKNRNAEKRLVLSRGKTYRKV